MKLRVVCAMAAVFLCGAAGWAEKAEKGVYNFNSLGFAYNPLGPLVDNRLTYRIPLSTRPGILWESTKLELGAGNSWTPVDDVVGVRATLEPIAFFSVTATAGFYGLYKALGFGFYPFTSANVSYGPDLPDDIKPQNASGYWLSLAPELKMQLGPFILDNVFTVNRISLDHDGYFLEVRSFSLQRTKDTHITNELTAGLELTPRLIAAGTYRYLSVLGTGVKSHRVGALALLLFPNSRFGSSFIAVNPGYYLKDPAFEGSAYIGMMAGMDLKIK